MIELHITGRRPKLAAKLNNAFPDGAGIVARARSLIGGANKREVWEEQALVIAYLASQYDRKDAFILEIGANRGFTAAVLKLAAKKALVTTLEPDENNRREARGNVLPLGVVVRPEKSTLYLERTEGSGCEYDMIFVDGDHKRVRLDLPWFNRLKVGGLFLHHDYSPLESARPCPSVFEALNDFGAHLGREADVLVVDNTMVGMAGWYRREGETWG